jgi:signal transduction histidine kinase/ActR/RegA family two-component response regulator
MKSAQSGGAGKPSVFSPISDDRIEEVNLRRIMAISVGVLAFEVINLFNPNFWSTPILWVGAIYLSVVSVSFLLALVLRRPAALFDRPDILNALFWVLFSVGFFPFLVRDARAGDSPLNCVLLCTVLICAPLLRVKNLWFIFGASAAVNLAAALYAAAGTPVHGVYYVELLGINTVAFFMARNLHGRYFSLLDDQRRLYSQQLSDKLAQEALQSKLEQDRLVNASRYEFLSRMSHDLRTPLNAVIGLSGIAMDETLSREEIQTYLGDINASAKHLLSLINDVLDMSKLESNRMTLRPEPCSTAEFLQTVQSVIGVQCVQKQIRFEAVCDDGFPEYLLVDKLRFHQIFLNLLSNALKFTSAGGEISLRLSHEAREDGKIDLTALVRDTGRGMEPEFAAHAFDAFTQERAEDGERGAGLGLTIVKSFTQLMGGSIQIDSRPGEGTCVTVRLPVLPAEPPAAETSAAAGQDALRGRRILVCEDQPLNQKVAQCLLEKAGMQAEIAGNGQIGVDMFAQSAPGYYDAVLMDVRMPVLDGNAAAAAIRALPRADSSVPIIAMTANAYEEDAEKSRAAGMNAHLSKPVDPSALYRTLAQFLPRPR